MNVHLCSNHIVHKPGGFQRLIMVCAAGFVLAASLHPSAVAQASTVIRVSTTGSNSPSCGSDSQPCRTVQYATNKAASGDTILVAKGTYNTGAQTCDYTATTRLVCVSDKDITIRGGYDESDWSTSDPDTNPTILDGGGSVSGIIFTVIQDNFTLNLEGITIQNGLASPENDGNAFGGGVFIQADGGRTGRASLKAVKIINNKAQGSGSGGAGSGGGLAVRGTSDSPVYLNMDGVTFQGNQAIGGSSSQGGVAIGGGLFSYHSTVNASNMVFSQNNAQGGTSSSGDGGKSFFADALGGAVGIQMGSSLIMNASILDGNKATGGNAPETGGSGLGGAIHSEASTIQLTDLTLSNNQALGGTNGTKGGIAMGGGVMADGSNTTLNRVHLANNLARSGNGSSRTRSANGGGAYFGIFDSNPNIHITITNAMITGNRVELGSAPAKDGGGGGGLAFQGTSGDLTHVTMAANTLGVAVVGIALVAQPAYTNVPANVTLSSSIVSDHGGGGSIATICVTQNASLTIRDTIESSNYRFTNSDNLPLPHGTINTSNVIHSSSINYRSAGDYHLSSSSPAIDQAVNSTTSVDIDQQPRPAGVNPDMGADEYMNPSLSTRPISVFVLAQSFEVRSDLFVMTNDGSQADWTANSSANWLGLGGSRGSKSSGTTGNYLQLWTDPTGLSLGTHTTTLDLASSQVDGLSVEVQLLKVAHLYQLFLPRIGRQP